MLVRVARWSFRRRRLMVFAIWLPLLVLVNAGAGAAGSNFRTEFDIPGGQSKEVQEILSDGASAEDAGFVGQIVFTARQGTDDPAVREAMTSLFERVDALEGVRVISPYTPDGQRFSNADRTISFAQLNFTERGEAETRALGTEIKELGDAVAVDGLTIEYGGQLFALFEFPESELLGILAAVIILLVAFGSVIAMGLPIGTALFGLGVGVAVVGLGSRVVSMPEFSTQMTAMIGLGVGIDYALFIVTRYRENLHNGLTPEESTVEAVNSSGRAVLFAGTTVMISLLGLFVIGLEFVQGLAVAGALGVLLMMIAAVTLLPALLGFAGHQIENTSRAAATAVGAMVLLALVGVFSGVPVGAAVGAGAVLGAIVVAVSFLPFGRSLRTPIPHRREKPREQHFWYRWSRFIQHRPWPAAVGGVAVLILLALPLLDIRLGFSDTGNLPEEQTARRAYDLLAAGFGEGSNGPLFLASTDPALDATGAAAVDRALVSDAGIAFASPGVEMSPGTWFWQAYPTTSPQDSDTVDLVERLREDSLPATGFDVKVGGPTAASIDFSDYLAGRLPILIGSVLVLSFILLMVVFRSVLVPLKAVVVNLLSVGAAYGVIVAIFQWGWAKDLFGVGKAGPVEAWAPMMLFAIVFGLSMDYEVFLLSRMREEFVRTRDNARAVADGLAVTARVITAAALIMVCVFGAFVLGNDRQLKLFGLGMAVAVLIDATVVRMILVPATMELLGARNWWMPRWLDRILPKLDVEGSSHPVVATVPPPPEEPERPQEREPELV